MRDQSKAVVSNCNFSLRNIEKPGGVKFSESYGIFHVEYLAFNSCTNLLPYATYSFGMVVQPIRQDA